MKKLYEFTQLIRSKNAGPFVITIDIIFKDKIAYEDVMSTDVLSISNIAKLYNVEEDQMKRYEVPLANALKFSYPRKHPSGDFMDDDLYGCQQHKSLVEIEVPIH